MMRMKKVSMVIPIVTLFVNLAILIDIPILREIIVFIFLSFIPGFVILKLFKLKEISFIDTVLFSVALSIASLMFMGLLVNEFYIFLGLSQPLSTLPLIVAISVFTLAVFFISCRGNLSETLKLKTSSDGELKNVFPLSIIMVFLPFLSILGVLYLNFYVILLSYAIMATLCLMSAVSRRLVPEKLYPFLILSISIALVCQVPMTSKYIMSGDANLEFYVFRLTQINGQWGFLNWNSNPLLTHVYNSMLSVTVLPTVYSTLMPAQGETVFKILYPFIFSLIPLAMYRICEKQFGKLIGLLSALFFVFTPTAFYGLEILSLNRQIVGELFLVLSVLILIRKTIPVTKRRVLLIILGAALVVSHYSLGYIYLGIIAVVFIISRVKPTFDNTLNAVTVLLLFGMTLSWYTLTNTPLLTLISTIKGTFSNLAAGLLPTSGTASDLFYIPQVFTVATWINLLVSGIADLFLIMGVLIIVLKPKKTGISAQYGIMMIMAASVLAIAYIVPSIASTFNFTRFYAITLLFLSPCFVLGGQAFIAIIKKAWTKVKRPLRHQLASKSKNINIGLLLIAIILCGYFLSQVGFANRVTVGTVHTYVIDFDRMKVSNDPQVEIFFYSQYIPEQDVFSAVWLLNHESSPSMIYADYQSGVHVLPSYGLIPLNLISPLTNSTIPTPDSFVYLSRLNIEDNIITTLKGSFNSSEIFPTLNDYNLVYSNGNGEIWCGASKG
jgi:uncharacterized membrane protein